MRKFICTKTLDNNVKKFEPSVRMTSDVVLCVTLFLCYALLFISKFQYAVSVADPAAG